MTAPAGRCGKCGHVHRTDMNGQCGELLPSSSGNAVAYYCPCHAFVASEDAGKKPPPGTWLSEAERIADGRASIRPTAPNEKKAEEIERCLGCHHPVEQHRYFAWNYGTACDREGCGCPSVLRASRPAAEERDTAERLADALDMRTPIHDGSIPLGHTCPCGRKRPCCKTAAEEGVPRRMLGNPSLHDDSDCEIRHTVEHDEQQSCRYSPPCQTVPVAEDGKLPDQCSECGRPKAHSIHHGKDWEIDDGETQGYHAAHGFIPFRPAPVRDVPDATPQDEIVIHLIAESLWKECPKRHCDLWPEHRVATLKRREVPE